MKAKASAFILFVLLFNSYSDAQTYAHQTMTRIETKQFPVQSGAEGYYYLPMNFNSADSRKILADIPLEDIVSVSLIYSQYKLSERFDQMALNQSRMLELFEQMPGLKSKKDVQWFWVAQTGCQSPEECTGYFHGFEIKIRTQKDKDFAELNNHLLDFYFLQSLYPDSVLLTSVLDSLADKTTSGITKHCDTSYIELYNSVNSPGRMVILSHRRKSFIKILNQVTPKSASSLSWVIDSKKSINELEGISQRNQQKLKTALLRDSYIKKSRHNGATVSTRYTMQLERNLKGRIIGYYLIGQAIDAEGNPIVIDKEDISYRKRIICNYADGTGTTLHENVVTEVLNRNKEWKNCLVVTDVTGSMSPYLGQFLAWHFLNVTQNPTHRSFVFFNDGDNKSDGLKKIGSTGGIYQVNTTSFEELKNTLANAQSRGSGGDGPENNLEAVIAGLEANPGIKEVIMIADNFATPRDIALISKIDRPIHFIMCGSSSGVNAAYLELARANGGTIHTIESDISRLSEFKEGETFSIGSSKYLIKNGKVLMITNR